MHLSDLENNIRKILYVITMYVYKANCFLEIGKRLEQSSHELLVYSKTDNTIIEVVTT